MNSIANWVTIQPEPQNSPLDSKDLASSWQGYMDICSLINLSSTSRGTYYAYRPQLDKRIIALFGVMVPQGATHQDVMQAFVQQIPKDETRLALDKFDKILRENEDMIHRYIAKSRFITISHYEFFQINANVLPLKKREDLLPLLSHFWMVHAGNGAWRIGTYLELPSCLRMMRAVANNLHTKNPSSPKPAQLESIATGLLLARGNTTTWPHFIAQWNTMNAQQQAATLLGIGNVLARARIEDWNHPAVLLVQAFIENKQCIWVDSRMQAICSHIVQARVANIRGLQNTSEWPKANVLRQLLEQLARPLADKEPVRTTIFEMMQALVTATNVDEIQAIEQVINERIHHADLQTEAPSIETLAYMVVHDPNNEKVKQAFANFRKSWKDMTACQQAQALYVMGKMAIHFDIRDPQSPAGMLLIDFAEAELLGWKNMSMQKACVYLVQQAQTYFHNVHEVCSAIVDMFKIIADPAHDEDLDTVFGLLSDMMRCCEQQEGVRECMDNWYQFTAQLAARKMDELGFTLTNLDL